MKILVTGAAGFIGYFAASRFLQRGDEVVGLDNLNAYYDVSLKNARLARLQPQTGFRFVRMDLARDCILPEPERRRYRRGTHVLLPGASLGSVGEPTLASPEKGKRIYEFIRGRIRDRVFAAGAQVAPA